MQSVWFQDLFKVMFMGYFRFLIAIMNSVEYHIVGFLPVMENLGNLGNGQASWKTWKTHGIYFFRTQNHGQLMENLVKNDFTGTILR